MDNPRFYALSRRKDKNVMKLRRKEKRNEGKEKTCASRGRCMMA
jgi:hypothetical protein